MSYTNHTTNLELPQYIGTDKPTYLGDFNTAMQNIDTGYASNKTLAETASTNASSALSTATSAASDATSAISTANSAATTAGQADVKADTALNTAASANTKADTAISNAATNATNIGDMTQLATPVTTDLVSGVNSLIPDILYKATGTPSLETISFAENITDYKMIDVEMVDADGNPLSTRILNPTTSTHQRIGEMQGGTGSQLRIWYALLSLAQNGMSLSNIYRFSSFTTSDATHMYFKEVIGYKYE